MRRLLLFILPSLVSLVSGSSLAQNWHWISPKPQGVSVNAIAVFGSQEWLVGDLGTIATTTDGAQSFASQSSETSANLNGVFFFDANHGWAVGDAGTIVATSDGGRHWAPQTSGSSRKLRGVYFTSLLKGFAVGDYRTLLETLDGGQTWAGLGSVVLTLDAVTFTDPLHGFICGDTGSILLTTDGGTSFNLVQTGTTAHLLAMSFADANHGFAVGLGGVVVTTSDGGHSWSSQVIGSDDLVGVAVLSATQVYALGSDGLVYATADGSNWAFSTSVRSSALFTFLGIEQNGSLDATAANGQWFHSSPLVAADGGAMAAPLFLDVNDLFSLNGDITAVAFGSQDAGVMVGELGFLYNTQDRGQHLSVVGPSGAGPGVGWTAVSMPTPTDAFAVGTQGSIAVSHDSGLTWAFLEVPVPEDLTAVQFMDALNGVVAASGGLLFTTDNGGLSWNLVSTEMEGQVHALAYNDPQHGVAAGDFGQIAWTVDGQNYAVSSLDIPFTIFGAAYPAAGVVLVSGEGGALSHSLNQGQAFFDLAPPTGASINALFFFDHQNGYLGGGAGAGTIWGTHDGAQSFEAQFTGAPSILGLSFADQTHGYAVGGNGTLLSTDTGGENDCQSDADCADAGSDGVQCVAGACQPCTEDENCGPACGPCTISNPICYGDYCGACLSDLDCPADGGYCVLGVCQVPKIYDLDAGPGDGGEEGDGGVEDGGGSGTTGGGTTGGTTGGGTSTGKASTTGASMGDCTTDPSLCHKSGCGTTQGGGEGGGAEAIVATALALAFCWPRRRR